MIRQKLLFSFVCVLLLAGDSQLFAQNQPITEPQLLYRKRFQYGFNLNSAGIGGLNFKYGWHKTGTTKNILDIELARVRHPKETRIYGVSDNPQQYTYGRLYMAFFLRTGYGKTIQLTERPYKNSVGLNLNYNIGITTAFLKPIYLDILHLTEDPSGAGRYGYVKSERYNPDIHNDPTKIYGNSSFFTGIGNTTTKVGGYGRLSLSVEWGQYPDEFHTLEAGCTVDVFPDALPLMAYSPKNSLFFILFIGYSFGLNK